MTKRSKLSLSASQETVKKRPAGFKVPPSPTPRPARTPRREQPAQPAAHPPPHAPPENSRALQKRSTIWLNASTVAKTILVVGATALAIVLLKRRLF